MVLLLRVLAYCICLEYPCSQYCKASCFGSSINFPSVEKANTGVTEYSAERIIKPLFPALKI